MKRVPKGDEPQSLRAFRAAVPQSTWQGMKDDAHFGGQQAYADCREITIQDQHGLCAFCEIDIRDNDPLKCHVEHFHPKSDITPAKNWALDWNNLLAVCNGGSYEHVSAAGYFLTPRDENLSCDQHKDRMIQIRKLPEACEGWILNPLQLCASPSLFRVEMSTGKLFSNAAHCREVTIEGNRHPTTEALADHTIATLNLNCNRLSEARLRIIRDVENAKKRQRQSGFNATDGLANIARHYFRVQWLGFFTTLRLCIGSAAESHLHSIGYRG